ncbi:DUF2878 domain-containing protein [Pseudorhodoferax sp. Leaf267]|uniref:DUF2878 domain-containing protein n=1 Tax=Pseudorhodoferax sp. Leaf267 TaxID=1736316 RepID=UPI0006F30672|nr:DUF2878 domain-containing protein [Pseudorhodoferax sp. Leaf267]KQP18365.1 hypothetical protein ASF43_11185 [Pseudorhodoferax sp. Leaf267]
MASIWPQAPAAPTGAGATTRPTRAMQLANVVISQAAWFAAVLGAAAQHPMAGTACVAAAIAWHLAVSARPAQEAKLVLLTGLVGAVVETLVVLQGNVAYPSGQPFSDLPPYWMVALWALLAIALNVTLRWLRGRWWLAAAVGAVAGPMAFSAGVRMGGAQFLHPGLAVATLALVWAVVLPVLVRLSARLDGVTEPEAIHA